MNAVEHISDWLSEDDLHWFNEGTHCHIYRRLGACSATHGGVEGTHFAVWAPSAARVFVMGDFNGWSTSAHPLEALRNSGIWSGFIPHLGRGATYKYHVVSRHDGYCVDKADPCGVRHETAPKTASLVWDLDHAWGDAQWMQSRGERQKLGSPISIYEVHLGSWMRVPEQGNRWLSYREMAPKLADYAERMGFMHDTLDYFGKDPIHRKYHHNQLTFRGTYAFSENFVLPFSHDEVVHGKGSLLSRMPGDDSRKFANLRLLLAYTFFQPGKKLLFMGAEFGQWNEWYHEVSLDWHLAREGSLHNGLQKLVGTLNWLYRTEAALHAQDASAGGFQWVDCHNAEETTLSWLRFGTEPGDVMLVACNLTPIARHNVRLGVPLGGRWREMMNTDALDYGGGGMGNFGGVEASPLAWHGQPYSATIALPPLGAVAFKPERPR